MIKSILRAIKSNFNVAQSPAVTAPNQKVTKTPLGSEELIKFLEGDGPNNKGMLLDDVLNQTDAWLEETHDFIQWTFPLTTPSSYQRLAPFLCEEQVQDIRDNNLKAKSGILKAYARYLKFLGLKIDDQGRVSSVPKQEKTLAQIRWENREDHNDLRISRVLKCLVSIGAEQEANAFYLHLATTFKDAEYKEESMQYWRDALE